MRKIYGILLSLCLTAIGLTACGQNNKQGDKEAELKRKIGQMIIAGFRGYEVGGDSSDVARMVRDMGVGGIIYFDRDVPGERDQRNIQSPEQLRKLTGDLQALAQIPLFIAVDQEGGKVSRLKESYGFPPTVSAAWLGKKNDPAVTQLWASQTARTLREAGINVNFAPCVDVNVNPACPVIGAKDRSFSADPAVVIEQAKIWVEESHKEGVLTSLKHFPGHGSSTTDSHLGLPDITQTWQEDRELAPYRTLLGEGYDDFMMVGHVLQRKVDPDHPASLSKIWIDSILRKGFNYQGVVITDDMNMGAVVEHYTLEKAWELSINAGVDMVILGNNGKTFEADLVPKTIDLIYGLVQSGRIPEERIDQSYERILKLKKRLR